jgi:hypothetical protein
MELMSRDPRQKTHKAGTEAPKEEDDSQFAFTRVILGGYYFQRPGGSFKEDGD